MKGQKHTEKRNVKWNKTKHIYNVSQYDELKYIYKASMAFSGMFCSPAWIVEHHLNFQNFSMQMSLTQKRTTMLYLAHAQQAVAVNTEPRERQEPEPGTEVEPHPDDIGE